MVWNFPKCRTPPVPTIPDLGGATCSSSGAGITVCGAHTRTCSNWLECKKKKKLGGCLLRNTGTFRNSERLRSRRFRIWEVQPVRGYEARVRTDHAPVVELFYTKPLTGKLARWSLIVQDFNPTFTYVPGAVNYVADSLSRYIGTIDDTELNKHEDVSRDHDLTLNASIRGAQRENSFREPLIYYLESGDPNALLQLPVPLPEFDLNDDLLVRHTYMHVKAGSESGRDSDCNT